MALFWCPCLQGRPSPKFYIEKHVSTSGLLPRIDDSHCDRIHTSLTAVRCFDNGKAASVLERILCAVLVKKKKKKKKPRKAWIGALAAAI